MSAPTDSVLHLPSIGLGTMRQQDETCRTVVEAALAEGYRHIDTARKYGNERAVGAGLTRSAVPRGDVLLTTKLGPGELTPTAVRAAATDSLRTLEVDYIDLLLVHWPDPDVPLADTLEAMVALKDAGHVRAIGVANFPAAMLEEAASLAELATDQVEFHPYLGQDAVLAACRRTGVVLTAYCPLARATELLVDPVVREIAAGRARTAAQVVLRWLVQQLHVVAIPGASSVEHLRENLAVEDFELMADEIRALDGLERAGRVVDPPFAPVWN